MIETLVFPCLIGGGIVVAGGYLVKTLTDRADTEAREWSQGSRTRLFQWNDLAYAKTAHVTKSAETPFRVAAKVAMFVGSAFILYKLSRMFHEGYVENGCQGPLQDINCAILATGEATTVTAAGANAICGAGQVFKEDLCRWN